MITFPGGWGEEGKSVSPISREWMNLQHLALYALFFLSSITIMSDLVNDDRKMNFINLNFPKQYAVWKTNVLTNSLLIE